MKHAVVWLTTALILDAPISVTAKDAAPYPSKPIRLIVPTVSGPTPDVIARVIGERLTRALSQTVVVENKPGAIGTIGLYALARAKPDGYTLGLMSMPYIIAPSMLAQV